MERYLRGLVEALASDDGLTRKRARETLTLVGDPAIPHVRDLLASTDKQVRWEAAKTLAGMIDPPSTDAFVRLLADPRSEVRWLAGDGLIGLGPRSVVPVLESLLAQGLPRGHRLIARRVLRELSTDNDVLAEIVGPVTDALGNPDPALLAPKVSRALSDLGHITGRLLA